MDNPVFVQQRGELTVGWKQALLSTASQIEVRETSRVGGLNDDERITLAARLAAIRPEQLSETPGLVQTLPAKGPPGYVALRWKRLMEGN